MISFLETLKENTVTITRLFAQTLVSGLLGIFSKSKTKEGKAYLCGVSIIAPLRQLRGNQRGPDFIIDNNRIHAEDVVYIPLIDLTTAQKNDLEKLPGTAYFPPEIGRYFSNFAEWRNLLWFAVKQGVLRNREEAKTASNVFFNFFRWSHVMKSISIRHFITHGDYGVHHVGRNIALNQAGVQTWYFTDSMNFGVNFKEDRAGYDMRHPFWSYLDYDHFVTWDKHLGEYFRSHPGTFKQTHVIGCLWSGHIREVVKEESLLENYGLKKSESTFVIAAFDSTYSRNGTTSYSEGLAFAQHILDLADECPDVHIFLKEKKSRIIHGRLDPETGPKLLELYNKMDSRDNITVCSNQVDASRLISASNLTVSFSFTSTTFEALSAGRPAIWHDPLGLYRHTPYAEAGGVTTHDYEELKQKVLDLKKDGPESYVSPLPADSPLMDPYMDGSAVERFRELLTSK
jgi:polysaccharide biosynthesis PFTS motif protein